MAAPRSLRVLANTPNTAIKVERNINKEDIRLWLAESYAKLKDAERSDNSVGTRMDCAYDALLQSSLAVLAAEGYRVDSSPGHHAVALEGAAATIGLGEMRYNALHSVKNWRNQKYLGGFRASPGQVDDAVKVAADYLAYVAAWLAQRPDLMRK